MGDTRMGFFGWRGFLGDLAQYKHSIFLIQFLLPNAACTKLGVIKWPIVPHVLTKIEIFSWNYFHLSSLS